MNSVFFYSEASFSLLFKFRQFNNSNSDLYFPPLSAFNLRKKASKISVDWLTRSIGRLLEFHDVQFSRRVSTAARPSFILLLSAYDFKENNKNCQKKSYTIKNFLYFFCLELLVLESYFSSEYSPKLQLHQH